MRRLISLVVVFTFAVSGLALLGCKGEGPTGKAVGTVRSSPEFVAMQKDMWGSLSKFQQPYLESYASHFQSSPDDPLALIAALDKLMYAVTGPSGMWRSHIPKKYFGCSANHDMPICQQFQRLDMAFLPWETLHVQLSSIRTPQEAEAFLSQYGDKLKQYLEYYVPSDKTLDAVQTTPFFKDQLSLFLR